MRRLLTADWRWVAGIVVAVAASAASWTVEVHTQTQAPAAPNSAACERLASAALPNATVSRAELVPAGGLVFPAGTAGAPNAAELKSLPAFCRVVLVIKPVPASTINSEVWLPVNWNGMFQGAANALWAGYPEYGEMTDALQSGAATAGTDGGHIGTPQTPPESWYKWDTNREQVTDFDWRAFRETTLKAKALVNAFYNRPPTLSYLIHPHGAGTRMSMRQVQRFPEDYDIVVAGTLATHQTHHAMGQLWVWQATHKTPAHTIEPEKYPAIHAAALAACDMNDGVKDGLIVDPPRCKFDPSVLLCKGADATSCLTAPQVEAARQIYSPPTTTDTKEVIFGPLMPGSELGWATMAGPQPFRFGTQILAYLVYKEGAKWDPLSLKFDSATMKRVDAPEIQPMNSWEADISKYIDRGGKLMLIGGWNDTSIAPTVPLDYYEAVMQKVGAAKARDSVRLFMVPGMGHAPGRTGARAYDLDFRQAIQQWNTTKRAPDQLVFTHWSNGKQLENVLVCAYPAVSTYKGTGSTTDPASYQCRPQPRLGWTTRPPTS